MFSVLICGIVVDIHFDQEIMVEGDKCVKPENSLPWGG